MKSSELGFHASCEESLRWLYGCGLSHLHVDRYGYELCVHDLVFTCFHQTSRIVPNENLEASSKDSRLVVGMTIAITLLISSAVSFWISSRRSCLILFSWSWRLLDVHYVHECTVWITGSEGKTLWRSWGSASEVLISEDQISASLWLSPAFEWVMGPSLPGETNVSKKCFARWKDSGHEMECRVGVLTGSIFWYIFVKAYLQLKDKMRTEFAKDRQNQSESSGLVEREKKPHQVLKPPCVGCSRRCLGIKAACTCERHAQVPLVWFCFVFACFCIYGNTQYTVDLWILKTFWIFLEPPNIQPRWKGASPRSTCTAHKVNMVNRFEWLAPLRNLRDWNSDMTWTCEAEGFPRYRLMQRAIGDMSLLQKIDADAGSLTRSYKHPSPHVFEAVWSIW